MPGGNGRYLVLYCSGTSNTERVAQQIQTTPDCDILEVEPQTAYKNDYNAMLDRAQSELAVIRLGNYPAIRTSVESFELYDVIFVGYPIWYGSMATPMQTFRHEQATKLAGKRIALFATSGSSGISSSVCEAQALCTSANHNLAQIKRAEEILSKESLHLSAVQNHYSLLYRPSEKAGILDYCKENGIDFWAYMVLE